MNFLSIPISHSPVTQERPVKEKRVKCFQQRLVLKVFVLGLKGVTVLSVLYKHAFTSLTILNPVEGDQLIF